MGDPIGPFTWSHIITVPRTAPDNISQEVGNQTAEAHSLLKATHPNSIWKITLILRPCCFCQIKPE